MKNRDIYWKYKIQESLYTGQWYPSPLQAPWDLIVLPESLQLFKALWKILCWNHHQLSLNLIDSLKSLPFQKWFEFWENPEATKCQIWTIQGLSHLGDLMFCQKILCRFIALLAQSFWMQQPYSTHAHSVASTTPWPVQCSRHCSHMLIRVHSPWLPGYTNVAWTNFTCSQWLNFFWTDLILHKDVYILQT